MPEAWQRRLHPHLRVLFNGDDAVNAMRAANSSSVASTLAPRDVPDLEPARRACAEFAAARCDAAELVGTAAPAARTRLDDAGRAASAFVNVIV